MIRNHIQRNIQKDPSTTLSSKEENDIMNAKKIQMRI